MKSFHNFAILAILPLLVSPAPPRDALHASKEWDFEMAAHLLRRAGFGGPPEQVEDLVQRGRSGAVDYLVDFESIEFRFAEPSVFYQPPISGNRNRRLEREERQAVNRFRRTVENVHKQNVQNHLLRRMILSPRPLEEKLVLFWHGHLTSGFREVRDAWKMYEQLGLFYRHPYGDFRTLLQKISRDAAMIRYLDTNSNRKQKPNENYARELMELFSMGVGNYTEQDIKEAARAFTGWNTDRQTGSFLIQGRQHDEGTKKFLGHTGTFDGDDIVDIILRQKVTAEYMAGKMWRYFAATEPEPEIVQALARILRKNDYDFRPMLRAMFRSDAFYSPESRHNHIKSPVELVVGTFRLLEIEPNDGDLLNLACRRMGQELLQPPNVAGWEGSRSWINTATIHTRYNFVFSALYGTRARQYNPKRMQKMMENMPMGMEPKMASKDPIGSQPPFNPRPILEHYELKTPEAIAHHFMRRLLPVPLSPRKSSLLLDYLRERMDPDPYSAESAQAIRDFMHLLMSTPQYQSA